ncbi:MAG: Smr/MutS family protein [Rhodospirillales bacterium]|nr:Smr/MutS family protein [Rhodospirillales bacterium]
MRDDRRRRQPSHEEIRLWRHVTRDAKPLPGRAALADANAEPATEPAPPKPATTAKRPQPPPAPPPSPPSILEPGGKADLDRRSAERLAKGQMRIEARLDLHGWAEAEAHERLVAFLSASHAMGRRCVLVITGKGREGRGVLKTNLPRWINEAALRPLVLAFTAAAIKDGGEGAFYVLLKRQREKNPP